MDKFETWIKESGLKLNHIALKLGICREYLWEIRTGKEKPSAKLLAKIKEFTNGQV